MIPEEAQKKLDEWLRPLKAALGLGDWVIKCQWLIQDCKGMCYPDPDHKEARISLSLEQADDYDDLLDTLFHELLHCLHAEFHLCRQATKPFVKKPAWRSIENSYTAAAERTVNQLQLTFLHGLGMGPADLIKYRLRMERRMKR